MKMKSSNKFLSFICDNRWLIIMTVLICTAWFNNECQLKINSKQIERLNLEIINFNNQFKQVDDILDKNINNINILNERIKTILEKITHENN